MHFIIHALHRRPIEPGLLAFGRGASAILLSMAFLAYVGYLIYQASGGIYADIPLLINTTQYLPYYPVPDIQMCVDGSPFTITSCDYWSNSDTHHLVPGCAPYLTYNNRSEHVWCSTFRTDQMTFIKSTQSAENITSLVASLDIYWRVENITGYNLYNTFAPSLGVWLFSPQFSDSRFTEEDIQNMIPQEKMMWRSYPIPLVTTINNWRGIHFSVTRYRAIRPYDVMSILGVRTDYVDIDTLQVSHEDWPLDAETSNRTKYGDFQGAFSVEMWDHNMRIQSEQRQHTVLGALALAGGCYGIIFAVHCALYGTPRITPFGFAHTLLIWYHRLKIRLTGDRRPPDKSNHLLSDTDIGFPLSNSTLIDSASVMHMDTIITKDRTETTSHLNRLESRVDELESILRNYFLDVDSLDDFRARRLQQQQTAAPHSDLPEQSMAL